MTRVDDGNAVSEKLALLFCAKASVTCTVEAEAPEVVAVPESIPEGLRVSPFGKVPETKFQLYGGVPPVAAIATP